MECYCIMVRTGGEENFKNCALEKLKAVDTNTCFYVFRKHMRARNGISYSELLFPGYVFMETEKLTPFLINIIKSLKGFYRFIFNNNHPQKLRGNDLEYYSMFRKNGELLDLSHVCFDEKQRIVIIKGPLKGFEGTIIRVNHRCKRVTVEINMFGCSKKIDLCYFEAEAV